MIRILLFFKRIFNFIKFYTLLFFKKENRDVYKKFKKLVANDSKFEDAKMSLLIQNTNKILNYSKTHVKYYRNIFKNIDFNTNDNGDINIKSLSELEKIPILTKSKIRENFEDLKSDKIHNYNIKTNSSGGSTGEKVMFLQDKNRVIARANSMYFRNDIGIKPWEEIHLLLWASRSDIGNPTIPNSLFSHLLFNNYIPLNSSNLSDGELLKTSKILSKIVFDYIRGYSQSLYMLSKYINRNSIKIKKQRLVISTATALDDKMKMEIEKAFKCRVIDLYGSREAGLISYNNLENDKKKILIEKNVVEIINNNGKKISKNEMGKLLITSLTNKVMPLIRYDIGDLASSLNDYNYLEYNKTEGRVCSYFKTRDGVLVDGTSLTFLLNEIEEIKQFQIIQHAYEKIEFKIVSKSKINTIQKNNVEKDFSDIFGKNCQYIWTNLDKISATESGKFLFIISKI